MEDFLVQFFGGVLGGFCIVFVFVLFWRWGKEDTNRNTELRSLYIL